MFQSASQQVRMHCFCLVALLEWFYIEKNPAIGQDGAGEHG